MCVSVCVHVLSCVQLFATPWTVARQDPLSMGFSWQEYWSGLPFPSPGNSSDPRTELESFPSPALAGEFSTTASPGKTEIVAEKWKWSRSVESDSLQPRGLQPTRLLRPWDFPGKSTGVGCHFFLQRIFPTQGSNLGLLNRRQMLYKIVDSSVQIFYIFYDYFVLAEKVLKYLIMIADFCISLNSVTLFFLHENSLKLCYVWLLYLPGDTYNPFYLW